jgi:hypothetical protein
MKSNRGAGFGFGNRFGGNNKANIKRFPSPDSYAIPTIFNPNNTTTTFAVHCKGPKTYSFGTGRE